MTHEGSAPPQGRLCHAAKVMELHLAADTTWQLTLGVGQLQAHAIGAAGDVEHAVHHLDTHLGYEALLLPEQNYSTVTDFAKFLGLSTSVPLASAVW